MLTRKVTYTDYDGNEREEELQFNLNKAELIKMLTMEGDYTLDKYMERLKKERNGKKIMEIFENILKMSYGMKSPDGRKFEKSEEIWNDFYQTEAYSEIFSELVMDAKKAADFINAVIPKELADEVEKLLKEHPEGIPAEILDYVPKDNNFERVDQKES